MAFEISDILIYGAGNTGKQICATLQELGFSPIGFLDARVTGKIGDLPVYSPNQCPKELKTTPVIIAVHNRSVSIREIESVLIQLGWKPEKIWSLVQFYRKAEQEGFRLPSLFWLGQKSEITENGGRIQEARSLFTDSQSLELFDAQIALRKTGIYSEILDQPSEGQYALELIDRNQPLAFVDVGAYDGDSIEDLARAGFQFREIYGFEPEPSNLRAFCQRLKKMNLKCPITVFPVGANDQFETLCFTAGTGESACFSAEGSIVIQTAPLDEMLINQPVSFIKMDVEGAEFAALRGAQQIIEQQQPILAICVYHCPNHLWEIPLLIASLNRNYQFFLRTYGLNCFETVCYAVPPKYLKD